MRPDVGFIQVLRHPPVQALQSLQALGAQLSNQLRLRLMAGWEARAEAPLRTQGTGGLYVVLGVVAAAGLAGLLLLASRSAEPVVLGLLGLLAVAGVFLVFGLLSGFLRLSERVAEAELIRSVADGLEHALQIVDGKGEVVYHNRALQRLTGRRSGRLATLEELFSGEPESAQAFFRLNRAAERFEPREEVIFARAGLGQAGNTGRWLQVSVRPHAGPRGDGERNRLMLWQVADITRERQREIETVSGLEATLAFYDRLPQGLLAVAADGRILHLNSTLSYWLGLRFDTGRSMALQDVLSADAAATVRATTRSAGSRVTRLDVDLLREDGRAFPAQLVCRGQGRGGVTSILVLERNVETGREGRAEADLRTSRLFQSAPFGIATVDAEGAIAASNAAFVRMFSLDGGQVPATIDELLPTTDEVAGRDLAKAVQRAISGRTGATPVEVSLGQRRDVARRIYVSPLGTGTRGRDGAILYVIDATEQKALELKFAQSHKMEAVGQLAGGVAHDFNNVLTAIIGFSDLLLLKHRPTDAAYRDIMNIKQSAHRAAGLVHQLLAFSRRQTLQAEVLELGETLTDLAALLNRALGEKIDLKIVSGRDLWYVKADKTQFVQVIINLAVNARDAMPDGGTLAIRTRNISERESLKLSASGVAAGEYALIEVQDTGCGMEPEVMAKIFEPFFTTKDVGKGTGLGLSTVYGIVKQTGGYVFAESEVGKGTTFRVFLPRHVLDHEEEVARERPEKKKEVPASDLTGTGRVLLVEDEDAVRNFAARALSRQGYEVLEAATGVEALEVMEREKGRIDIVVSDVIMPEMDGPTMLKEMRKTKPHLKIIFVSGHTDDAFRKSLDENEAFTFLPKPFTLPQLAAKVKEQLQG
jgi:two-component system, cell cycle sensor histidine kinase and response regulator CckA